LNAVGWLAGCSVLLLVCALRELGASGHLAGIERRLRREARRPRIGLPLLAARERLIRAGLMGRVSPSAVLAGRGIGALLGITLAPIAAPAAPGRLSWLVIAGLPAAGFLAPDALLERVARRRREQLLGALPDALDLLAVNAASGRSTAAGLAQVSGAGDSPLANEAGIAVAEISAGMPQDRALARVRERVPGSELAAVVATIERSRRYGSPLADQLRRQASSLRADKSRWVGERAARAAPKIQLVVALVLVPSVLLMIAAGLLANADRLLVGF